MDCSLILLYLDSPQISIQKWQLQNPFFQCVCYWYNLLQWIYDCWKTLFFKKVYRYPEIFLTAMLLLSLKPVFWKKSIFLRYLHTKGMMLIPRFKNKADYASSIFGTNFTVVTVPYFSLPIKFFFIKDIFFLLRYANADLKISLYILNHIKMIPWKFCILNRKNSRVIYP